MYNSYGNIKEKEISIEFGEGICTDSSHKLKSLNGDESADLNERIFNGYNLNRIKKSNVIRSIKDRYSFANIYLSHDLFLDSTNIGGNEKIPNNEMKGNTGFNGISKSKKKNKKRVIITLIPDGNTYNQKKIEGTSDSNDIFPPKEMNYPMIDENYEENDDEKAEPNLLLKNPYYVINEPNNNNEFNDGPQDTLPKRSSNNDRGLKNEYDSNNNNEKPNNSIDSNPNRSLLDNNNKEIISEENSNQIEDQTIQDNNQNQTSVDNISDLSNSNISNSEKDHLGTPTDNPIGNTQEMVTQSNTIILVDPSEHSINTPFSPYNEGDQISNPTSFEISSSFTMEVQRVLPTQSSIKSSIESQHNTIHTTSPPLPFMHQLYFTIRFSVFVFYFGLCVILVSIMVSGYHACQQSMYLDHKHASQPLLSTK